MPTLEGGRRLTGDTDRRPPRFSIITVVYNGAKHIEDAIESVHAQSLHDVEHIVIDGGSRDGTLDILQRHSGKIAYWRSEPDQGIYDGMNKGIRLARGEVVGLLNSDDYYENTEVLATVNRVFQEQAVRCVFGNVRFVDGESGRVVRRYRSENRPEQLFRWGFMPAHPTFFAWREDYLRYGLYKADYRIAADYELVMRFLRTHRLSYRKIDEELIVMRLGGASTAGLGSTVVLNREIIRACRENGVYTNFPMLSLKYLRKLREVLPSFSR